MNILIVDDEPLARMRMIRLLNDLGHEQCEQAENGVEAIEWIEKKSIDLVFLDIQMPLKSGMETAAEINLRFPHVLIILCTAYDEYALEAFQHTVHDYLLKPVTHERLRLSLKKISTETVQTIAVKRGKDILNIELNQITCLIADGKYVCIHVANDEYVVDAALQDYESKYAKFFIRIHRNALVSRFYLQGIHQSNGGYQAILRNSELRPVISRRQLPRVREVLQA